MTPPGRDTPHIDNMEESGSPRTSWRPRTAREHLRRPPGNLRNECQECGEIRHEFKQKLASSPFVTPREALGGGPQLHHERGVLPVAGGVGKYLDLYNRHQKETIDPAKEDFRSCCWSTLSSSTSLKWTPSPVRRKWGPYRRSWGRRRRVPAVPCAETSRWSSFSSPASPYCYPFFDMRAHFSEGKDDRINLVILGKDGLAREFANEIRALCTNDDRYVLDGKIYELTLRPIEGNVRLFPSTPSTRPPSPRTAACVCTTPRSP
ncbi:unnamed protein product [Boreogadus saida]